MMLPKSGFVNASLLTLNLDVFSFIVYVIVSLLKVYKIYLCEYLAVVLQPNAHARSLGCRLTGSPWDTRIHEKHLDLNIL